MNENLYGMFDKVLQSEYSIISDGSKKTIELGKDAKYGKMETYSLFDGIIIAFMNININNIDNVFFEDKLSSRLLQINHCAKGRYSYAVGDDKIVYFGKGDLCVSIYDFSKLSYSSIKSKSQITSLICSFATSTSMKISKPS